MFSKKLKSKFFWIASILCFIFLTAVITISVCSIKEIKTSYVENEIDNEVSKPNIRKLLSSKEIDTNNFEKVELLISDKYLILKKLTNYYSSSYNWVFSNNNIENNLIDYLIELIKLNGFSIENIMINVKYKIINSKTLKLDIRWTNKNYDEEDIKDKKIKLYYSLLEINLN